MYDFSDNVVLVTGASGNLGAAVARAFAEAGAALALSSLHPARIREALPELTQRSEVLVTASTDLMLLTETQSMVDAVYNRYGRIDVLVNTVGGYEAGSPVHETPVESWARMMDLNARSAFVVSRAVIPLMLEGEGGKIVHTAARGGLAGRKKMAAYAAAKSAVIRLTESLSEEVKGEGINVNCVLPGTIDTPENREAMASADHSRWIAPEEIARVILFLASDDARAIHGAAIPVYGLS